MRLFVCHDYGPNGRDITLADDALPRNAETTFTCATVFREDDFVALRTSRDRTLGMPKLLIPSIQVNIRGGELPSPDAGGKRFLKVPINAL